MKPVEPLASLGFVSHKISYIRSGAEKSTCNYLICDGFNRNNKSNSWGCTRWPSMQPSAIANKGTAQN